MKHAYRWLAAGAILLVVAGSAMATNVTFATFADPSSGSANSMFVIAPDYSSIAGSWSGNGLSLKVPFANQVYQDVHFQLYGSGDPTQPGYVQFWNDTAGQILRVSFTSASLTEFGFGARDTTANPGRVELTYFPWGASFDPANESFSFSFSNFSEDLQGNTLVTAAFTSSAALPEPATAGFFVLGCVATLVRRRP